MKDEKQIQAEKETEEYCAYLTTFVNTATNQPTDVHMGSALPRLMAARALGASDAMFARINCVPQSGVEGKVRSFEDLLDKLDEMCRRSL